MPYSRRHLLAGLLCSRRLRGADPATYAVYRSPDAGRTWLRADRGLPAHARFNAFAAPSAASPAIAGTDAGAFLSPDGGSTWGPTPVLAVPRVLALAATPRLLFAATAQQGLWQSPDSGLTWLPVPQFLPRRLRSLLAAGSLVAVGTDDGEVYLSRDDGRTWQRLAAGLPQPAQIFDLAFSGPSLFAALYARGLFRWSETAAHWQRAGDLSPLVLATATLHSATFLLAGLNPGGLHLSQDRGDHFTPAHSTVPGQPAPHAPVWSLAASGPLALAGAASGVFLSRDAGRSWTPASPGLPPASPGIAFHLRGDHLLAAVILAPPA